jgi:branched-chain amino acid transport system substrate-binding protein
MSIYRIIYLPISIALLFTSAVAEEAIKVGVLTSLSGNWAAIGENMQRGISLAEEDINKSGGTLNRKFSFDFQDTQEEVSGAKVVTAYRNLRNKGINIFIGPTGVPGEKALVPVAKNDDVIIISSNTGPQIQNYSDNFFNSAGSNEFTTKASAEKAFKDGAKRIAIFSSQQPWESDQAKFFEEEFKKQGGEIVSVVSPLPEERDLKSEAMTLLRSKPDAIFFAVFNQVAIAAMSIRNLGFNGSFYAALLDADHIKNANGALESAMVYQFRAPSQKFIDSLKAKYSIDPVYPIDFTYDAVIALHEAIKVADSVEPKAIKAALHKIKFIGSSGKETTLGASGLIAREIEIATVRNNVLQ